MVQHGIPRQIALPSRALGPGRRRVAGRSELHAACDLVQRVALTRAQAAAACPVVQHRQSGWKPDLSSW